ncbi:AI-2E family transporter [Aquiflexum sp. LQ15W]|uniref:AI-2E family transporter n=1 Tax=Cognataquiflexum nitidum TaxID=2922272 RepID=UPI001F139930|nr:AI-2E family transporter [Cognataquiflexum nitidum]MCH6200926.1 AI-2E family transporter [Cognataquiflexum nitidum]
MNQGNFNLPPYLKALAVLLLIIVIVFILIIGRSLLVPLFLAGLVSILLTPMSDYIESKKISRVWSTVISLVSGLVFIFGLMSFIVFQIASFGRDLGNVKEKLNVYLVQIDGFISDKFQIETGIGNGIDKHFLLDWVQTHSSSLAEFVFGTIGSLSMVLLLPVFIFFFLLYRDHLTLFLAGLFPRHDKEKVKMEILVLRKVVQSYIVGVLKVMVILAILNTAVLFGLGIKHAIFFGVFAAVLNIVPYLGPLVALVLPVVFAFLTKDGLFYPIGIIVSFQLIQMIEANFLTPKIVGSNVNLNAFATFLGLLVGASIWGVVGMILIIPALAVLRKIFELTDATKPYALLLGEEKNDIDYFKE